LTDHLRGAKQGALVERGVQRSFTAAKRCIAEGPLIPANYNGKLVAELHRVSHGKSSLSNGLAAKGRSILNG
jgi:hypothetical protein